MGEIMEEGLLTTDQIPISISPVKNMYAYTPLVEDEGIRLVVLYPASSVDDDLHVNIIHTTLSAINDSPDEPHAYTALSYVWGDQKYLMPVYIGENHLFIGRSLHSALRHLRKLEEEMLVWADGLCINQQDIKERNHQVHQMRNIYSKAAETVAYIGNEGGNTCLSAWNYLERGGLEWKSDPQRLKESATDFCGEIGDVENDVLSRPWFRRIWVVQEVTVSRTVVVRCGSRSVSWDSFCKVVLLEQRLNDRYGFSLHNRALYEDLLELFLTRCAFLISRELRHLLPPWYDTIEDTQAQSDHILDMTVRSRRRQASDPRDKVFALLGISSGLDLEDPRIAIDYSKPVDRVFTDFASYLIESSGRYDVLSHAGYNKGLTPSWAPMWSRRRYRPRTILSLELPQYKIGELPQELDHEHPLSEDGYSSLLRCRGSIIGEVKSSSGRIGLQGRHELMFELLREKYKAAPQEMRTKILEKWKQAPRRVTHRIDYDSAPPQSYKASNSRDTIESSSMYVPSLERPIGTQTLFDDTGGHDSTWDAFGGPYPHLWSQCIECSSGSDAPLVPALPIEGLGSGASDGSTSRDTYAIRKFESIENHLVHRSRQTVLWTEDAELAGEIITDKSSIIDGRQLAAYTPSKMLIEKIGEHHGHKLTSNDQLALVGDEAEVGDIIVTLEGGDIPYVVRRRDQQGRSEMDELHSTRYILIGECYVNNFELIHDYQMKFGEKEAFILE